MPLSLRVYSLASTRPNAPLLHDRTEMINAFAMGGKHSRDLRAERVQFTVSEK